MCFLSAFLLYIAYNNLMRLSCMIMWQKKIDLLPLFSSEHAARKVYKFCYPYFELRGYVSISLSAFDIQNIWNDLEINPLLIV